MDRFSHGMVCIIQRAWEVGHLHTPLSFSVGVGGGAFVTTFEYIRVILTLCTYES
jgi:hypothetical protein